MADFVSGLIASGRSRSGQAVKAGRAPGALAAALALLMHAASAAAAPELKAVRLGTFDDPVHVAFTPAHPGLLFVVERPGRIRVMRDEEKLSRPFLDIRDIVLGSPDSEAGSEQGLLSVAFPPDYAESGRFYVFFTKNNWDLEIAEFRRSADSSTRADRSSRRTLLTIPHRDAQNHNGGQLLFDEDGLLYISVGDGGATPNRAQRLDSLLGKILRIRPLRKDGEPYSVPGSNPFVGRPGHDEIFASGLRNPWRVSIDGRRIAIADVGQDTFEEVNLLLRADAAGANFGWPHFEGDESFGGSNEEPDGFTFPVETYRHTNGRCSVTGGFVIRDPGLPAFQGRYVYGDFCSGQIRSFRPDVAGQEAVNDSSTGLKLPLLTSFGVGRNGQLYAAQTGGPVSRIEQRN